MKKVYLSADIRYSLWLVPVEVSKTTALHPCHLPCSIRPKIGTDPTREPRRLMDGGVGSADICAQVRKQNLQCKVPQLRLHQKNGVVRPSPRERHRTPPAEARVCDHDFALKGTPRVLALPQDGASYSHPRKWDIHHTLLSQETVSPLNRSPLFAGIWSSMYGWNPHEGPHAVEGVHGDLLWVYACICE